MLEKMRNNTDSLVVKALLYMLALSFIGWGIGDYISGGYDSTAIEVNGEKVSIQDVAKEYNRTLKNVENRFGDSISPEMSRSLNIAGSAMNNLVQQSIVDKLTTDMNLRVSNEQLREMLFSTTSFQDKEGNFNNEIYKNTVRNAGLTTEGYENQLRTTALRSTLIDMFSTPFSEQNTIERHLKFNQERMDIQVLQITRDSVAKPKAATAEEMTTYFEQNAENFNTEEDRNFTVMTLSLANLTKNAEATEAQAKEVYDTDPSLYSADETRTISHILLKTEEDATRVRDLLDQEGADFAKIAKAESTDAFTKNKGGDLGEIKEGDLEAAFTDAAFSLEANVISEPVKTAFGYHIVKVTNIAEARDLSFDEAKAEIIKTLQAEKAEDLYYNLLEEVEDRVAGGEGLKTIASELNLETEKHEDIKFSTAKMANAEQILPIAFEQALEEVSEGLELIGDTGLMYVQTTNINPSRPLTFDEAKETIAAALFDQKVTNAVNTTAAKSLQARLGGSSMKQIAKANKLGKKAVSTIEGINRNRENTPQWLTDAYMQELFIANVGGVVNKIIPTGQGYAIVELTKREIPATTQEMTEEFRNALQFEMSTDLQQQFLSHLLNEAQIKLNEPLLKNTLGEAYIAQ